LFVICGYGYFNCGMYFWVHDREENKKHGTTKRHHHRTVKRTIEQ